MAGVIKTSRQNKFGSMYEKKENLYEFSIYLFENIHVHVYCVYHFKMKLIDINYLRINCH